MPVTLNRLLSDNIPVDPSKNTFTGNGSQTVFNLTGQIALGSTNPSNLIVSLDGAIQEPGDDYTVNNSVLTFTSAPDSGARVVVVSRNSPFTYATNVPGDGSVTSAKIVAGNVTTDKLSTGAPFWNSLGNVALGHSSPATNLHLNYSNYAAILMGANNSTGFSFTKETPSNTFNIWTGAMGSGTNRLCITSSGDIGIGGIISPQNKLDVNGVIGFGLRSGGQNQPGYLSNIWSNTDGYRFFTLGSSYFNGTNWITNPSASFGSNNVCTINGDTGGISIHLNANTGNFQRTDPTATFGSFEKIRINMNGTIDVKNNPINNCPTTAKSFLNWSPWHFANFSTGQTAPGSTSIDQIVAGLDTGRITWNSNWDDRDIGIIWYLNINGNNTQYGGIDWSKGIQITSINGIFAFFKALGGPATTTMPAKNGDGTTAGFIRQTFGIRNSFNILSVARSSTGRFRVTFITPMINDWYVVSVGSANRHDGNGPWTVVDYGTSSNPATFGNKTGLSTKNYVDLANYNSAGTAPLDPSHLYLITFDQDY
jgi:hypothetical protein